MCISKTSELAERQLYAQNENKMVVDEAGNTITKLCTGQATKNVLEDGSTVSMWAQWD